MPIASPAELWRETGRWDYYGKELIRFKDRQERDFCLGPTHEEVITVFRREVRSYRQLPRNFYQIQTSSAMKSARASASCARGIHHERRLQLRRGRGGAGQLPKDVRCLRPHFHACGLKCVPVEADTGVIGGKSPTNSWSSPKPAKKRVVYSEQAITPPTSNGPRCCTESLSRKDPTCALCAASTPLGAEPSRK